MKIYDILDMDLLRIKLKPYITGKGEGVSGLRSPVLNGRLPSHSSISSELTKKANKFLSHQEKRINRLIENNDHEKAVAITLALLKQSKSYKSMWFHRCIKGGYLNSPRKEIDRIISRFHRNTLKARGVLQSKRVYIPKGDGRLRPLGVPSPEWRIEIKAVSDLLLRIIDKSLAPGQHGFRPGKSAITAWQNIFSSYRKGYHIIEFDLDSCFNRINLNHVDKYLRELNLPDYFVNGIYSINSCFPFIKYEKIDKSDKEVGGLSMFTGDKQRTVEKRGMPQGLAGSPILSILVIDRIFKEMKINPIMYADDGIIITDEDPEHILERLQDDKCIEAGIVVSDKIKDGKPVTGIWKGPRLSFLGLSFPMYTKVAEYFSRDYKALEEYIESSYNPQATDYSSTEQTGRGHIHPDSIMYRSAKFWSGYNLWNMVKHVVSYFSDQRSKYQRRWLYYFDPGVESSRHISYLLNKLKRKKTNSQPFRKYDTDILGYSIRSRSGFTTSRPPKSLKHLLKSQPYPDYRVPGKYVDYKYNIYKNELLIRDRLMGRYYRSLSYRIVRS